MPTGRRLRSPNRRRRPVCRHRHWPSCRGGRPRPALRVTGGGGPPPSPPVTRPGSGPLPLPVPRATVAPPSQPPRQNPSVVRACCQAGRVLSLPGGRVLRAPAGETREKRHTERMRPPRPRAPFPPDSAREGRLGSLRSRWSRSRSRSLRTCNWRSSSVVPPQTPCTWCVARAYCRHWRRTRQAPQTSFALAISPAPGPCALTGKNSSGSASRQAADRHQSRRSSASAAR
jgi:hypothetical protein